MLRCHCPVVVFGHVGQQVFGSCLEIVLRAVRRDGPLRLVPIGPQVESVDARWEGRGGSRPDFVTGGERDTSIIADIPNMCIVCTECEAGPRYCRTPRIKPKVVGVRLARESGVGAGFVTRIEDVDGDRNRGSVGLDDLPIHGGDTLQGGDPFALHVQGDRVPPDSHLAHHRPIEGGTENGIYVRGACIDHGIARVESRLVGGGYAVCWLVDKLFVSECYVVMAL